MNDIELAFLLKDKGYNEYTNRYIVTEYCACDLGYEIMHFYKGHVIDISSECGYELCPEDKRLKFPDYYETINWLIKKHNLYVCVNVNASGWYWEIVKVDTGTFVKDYDMSGPNDGGCWDDRFEAIRDGIINCLKLI